MAGSPADQRLCHDHYGCDGRIAAEHASEIKIGRVAASHPHHHHLDRDFGGSQSYASGLRWVFIGGSVLIKWSCRPVCMNGRWLSHYL